MICMVKSSKFLPMWRAPRHSISVNTLGQIYGGLKQIKHPFRYSKYRGRRIDFGDYSLLP